jgi:SAM-dependent methyltransferase
MNVRFEMITCPVCSAGDGRACVQGTDRLHGLEGRFGYVECPGCGAVYMNPRMEIQEIPKFYPADYAPHASPARAAGTSRPGKASPPSPLTRAKSWWDDFCRNEKIIPAYCPPLGPSAKVLDVGCGNGKFLHEIAGRFGCQVQGVDLSDTAAKAARDGYGLEIALGTLESAGFPGEHFDVVTAWWYLEHVPNPVQIMVEIARILKPGGVCIMGVPNTRSLAARLFGPNWYHLDSPRHLVLYNPRSMRNLIAQAGLEWRKAHFDKTPWGMLGSLAYAAGGDGAAARRIRRRFLLRQALFPVTLLLGLTGWGDTMVVYARKPG